MLNFPLNIFILRPYAEIKKMNLALNYLSVVTNVKRFKSNYPHIDVIF